MADAAAIAVEVSRIGLIDYERCWRAMQQYTDTRTADSPDCIWLLQHHSVFTLGQAGRAEHVLDAGTIPVIKVDRGGQVTWHGPGQCVVYLMLDMRRLGLNVRELVDRLEQAVIAVLSGFGITAQSRRDAPGVYVDGAKIAALGLRVRRGCSFHGLSFNIDPDLAPFARINPCGYPGLNVTRLRDLVPRAIEISLPHVESLLLGQLIAAFGYNPQLIRERNALSWLNP
jgi:lipoyl(octanoyl) transferase